MQLLAEIIANNVRNAKCADTQTSIEWPYSPVHFLHCDAVYYTVIFLLKHPFYFPILFGGQHSEGHSALTMWTIIAQAEQKKPARSSSIV